MFGLKLELVSLKSWLTAPSIGCVTHLTFADKILVIFSSNIGHLQPYSLFHWSLLECTYIPRYPVFYVSVGTFIFVLVLLIHFGIVVICRFAMANISQQGCLSGKQMLRMRFVIVQFALSSCQIQTRFGFWVNSFLVQLTPPKKHLEIIKWQTNWIEK